MLSEDIEVFNEYLDKFIASDLTLIKINDVRYSSNFLRKGLVDRIEARSLSKINVYTILNELYLEKT